MAGTCPSPDDDSYDVIMETQCPITFTRCKWTVKDFTQYPTEEIGSHLFDTNGTDACEFSLRNFTCDDPDTCPEFTVKYFGPEDPVYATLKVFFYDSGNRELYRMEKTTAFQPPNRRDFQMKNFPQKKVWDLQDNTLIVECEMTISRPEQILLKPGDERSQSPETTTSEDQKIRSSKESSPEGLKSQASKESSPEGLKSQASKESSPEDKKVQGSKVSSKEDKKIQTSKESSPENKKIQTSKESSPEGLKSQSSKESSPEGLKSQSSKVSSPEGLKSQASKESSPEDKKIQGSKVSSPEDRKSQSWKVSPPKSG